MKYGITSIIITLLFLSTPLTAFAGGIEETCQPIFGGGKTCVQTGELTIDLKVQHPQSKKFQDTINRTDYAFLPGDTVSYEMTITNISSKEAVSDATIKVLFPQFIDYGSGSGKYDNKTKNLTFTINNLAPTKKQSFAVTGKVVAKEKLPKNQDSVCVITQAIATNGNKQSQDNSQICLQKEKVTVTPLPTKPQTQAGQTTKGGLPVLPKAQTKQTPQTGPEALGLVGLLPAAGLGYWLRKKTS